LFEREKKYETLCNIEREVCNGKLFLALRKDYTTVSIITLQLQNLRNLYYDMDEDVYTVTIDKRRLEEDSIATECIEMRRSTECWCMHAIILLLMN